MIKQRKIRTNRYWR